jgi:hypothetical protein
VVVLVEVVVVGGEVGGELIDRFSIPCAAS